MAFITYGVLELDERGVPQRPVIAFLDADPPQAAFSLTDKWRIETYLYPSPSPSVRIDIAAAPLNDSNLRSHDRPPDCKTEDGRRVWVFPQQG